MRDKPFEQVADYEDFVLKYANEIPDRQMVKEYAKDKGVSIATATRLKNISRFPKKIKNLMRDEVLGMNSLDWASKFDKDQMERVNNIIAYIIEKYNPKQVTRPMCKVIIDCIKDGMSDFEIKKKIDKYYVSDVEEKECSKKRLPSTFRAKYYFTPEMSTKEKGDIFENWTIERLEKQGFSCKKTPTNTPGADIIARNCLSSYLIECKSSFAKKGYVTPAVVEALYKANKEYKCTLCVIIAYKKFSKEAQIRAKELGVILKRSEEI